MMAIDGGKTKTSCVLFDGAGRVLSSSLSGPSGVVLPKETVRSNLSVAISSCLAKVNVNINDVSAITFGLADIDTRYDRIAAEEAVRSLEIPTSVKVIVEHDMVTAYYAVTFGKPGIVVISGTGSIAFGMNAKGERARSFGWGWIIDDEGSAYWIAKEAMATAAREYEGRGSRTMLTTALMDRFGLSDLLDIIYVVHKQMEGDPSKIAELSTLVDNVAERGDESAFGIMTEAGIKLGEAVYCLALRLNMMEDEIIVGGVGSVFKSTLVRKSFRSFLEPKLPKAVFKPFLTGYQALVGSAIIGMRAIGLADVEAIADRFRSELEE